MKRAHQLAGLLIVGGLAIMLFTFRIATAPGFIAMLTGAAVVVTGMACFVTTLIRSG